MYKDTFVFDLDGTLSDAKERGEKFLLQEPKNWAGWHADCVNDPPMTHIIAIMNSLKATNYRIVIATGRNSDVMKETIDWLARHGARYDKLIMRPSDVRMEDTELKRMWIFDREIELERVIAVFEDRSRMVQMWRDLGLPCLQVAPGDF